MFRKLILITLALTIITPLSANVIHKWVDENGVTHYSQQPPMDAGAISSKIYSEDLEQKPIGFIQPKVRENNAPVLSEDEKNANAIKKQNSEQASAICKSAKQNLHILKSNSRIRSKNEETGELVSMKEEDRQQEINTQQERVKLFCDK
jgi:hypothetical protein